ncbi:hereditary hemochromatosis protein homolog, partial [Cricetulus griseus]|uniref:hereditary hemochromatosis protein homolog n=1 Tax=Cricetulus griseus TaxID=10029 RepID=UPI00022F71D9
MLFISTYETLRQRIAWFRSLKAELTVGTHELVAPGPHTLRYDHLTTSLEGPEKILALGYFNDKLFLLYKGDSRTAEALRPRIKGRAGAETWARVTEDLWKEQLRVMLAEVTRHIGQDRGNHTIQMTFGCELQGNRSTRGFWRLGYDGQNSLTFDQKTLTWTMAVPSTKQTKTFWEICAPKASQVKAFLEDTCPAQLQKYLASSKKFLLDT